MSPAELDATAQATHILNLKKEPSYNELLTALNSLAIQPTSWTRETSHIGTQDKDVDNFLMAVLTSDLAWFDKTDDAAVKKEEVLDLASKRIAERCGRSAMPEMTRTWVIPESANHPELKFTIKEPSITGDNLGLKTWGTAFAISKKINAIGLKHFTHLFTGINDTFTTASGVSFIRPNMRVLELGSGTGLVGLATAAIWKCNVILTDLPAIVPNLCFNVTQNADIIARNGGNAFSTILDWANPNGALTTHGGNQFEVVIAADPLYDDNHPKLVATMIQMHLKFDRNSRALTAVPMRDKSTRALYTKFVELMRENGLQIVDQGGELFFDDWATANDKGVQCWWCVWRYAIPWV